MDNQNLFEHLRDVRNQIAREEKVKPFIILHNSVLKEISEKRPKTLEELKQINGMGEKRITRYGGMILGIVNGTSDNTIFRDEQEEKIFSVSEYIDSLNRILEPQEAVIQGEISSIDDRGNYIFFTLQDKTEEAVLKCFMWKNKLYGLGIELEEGLELKIQGYPSIYKKYGRFTFEVQYLGLIGEGALKLAFERLKKKLELEGYFAKDRKKRIAEYVQSIGLITSNNGDAIKDFKTHLGDYGFKIYFYNSHVEGLHAVDDMISAIRWFNENMFDIDVLVLTRGGGSLENLQAFNTESIAKAIFGSRIPIITGIGHENDDTIADFVSDIRASTPTAAARILSDPWRNAKQVLLSSEKSIVSIFRLKCEGINENLISLKNFFLTSFHRQLQFKKQLIENLQEKLTFSAQKVVNDLKSKETAFHTNWERLKNKLMSIQQNVNHQEVLLNTEAGRWIKFLESYIIQTEQKLSLGDPTLRLKQGYSIVFNLNDKVIKSTRQLKLGDKLKVKLYEGGAVSSVEKIQA